MHENPSGMRVNSITPAAQHGVARRSKAAIPHPELIDTRPHPQPVGWLRHETEARNKRADMGIVRSATA
jgi:hypothetical protein